MTDDELSLSQLDAIVQIIETVERDSGDRIRAILVDSAAPLVTCGERSLRAQACGRAGRTHRPTGSTWMCVDHGLGGYAITVAGRVTLLGIADAKRLELVRGRLVEAARAIAHALGEPGGAPAQAWAGFAGQADRGLVERPN